jgi:hypothetical protein
MVSEFLDHLDPPHNLHLHCDFFAFRFFRSFPRISPSIPHQAQKLRLSSSGGLSLRPSTYQNHVPPLIRCMLKRLLKHLQRLSIAFSTDRQKHSPPPSRPCPTAWQEHAPPLVRSMLHCLSEACSTTYQKHVAPFITSMLHRLPDACSTASVQSWTHSESCRDSKIR